MTLLIDILIMNLNLFAMKLFVNFQVKKYLHIYIFIKMCANINDLPNEILCLIFEFLPYKQMVRNELVCTKWQECVLIKLQSEETLQSLDFY